MIWTLAYSSEHPYTDKPVVLPHLFNNSLVIIRASSLGASISWKRAGFIYPRLSIAGVGNVEGSGRAVYLKTKILKFESLGLPFYLEFRFLGHIPDISLSVWETDDPPADQEIRESLARIEAKLNEPPDRQLSLEFFEGP